jgi:4'-phosphopantetheinyl transferase EntD
LQAALLAVIPTDAMNHRDAHVTLTLAVSALRCAAPPGFHAVGALADEHLAIPAADRAHVDRAVPRRRAEFIAGRWCAHQALRAISMPAAALPTGRLGAPCWPVGAVGSITHDAGYCVAVAGPAASVTGIGIDWCDDTRLAGLSELAEQVVADAERGAFAQASSAARHLQRLFCAKEAVVKACSASVGQFDAVQAGSGAFSAHIAGHAFVVRGRLLPVEGHALAMAWLEAA